MTRQEKLERIKIRMESFEDFVSRYATEMSVDLGNRPKSIEHTQQLHMICKWYGDLLIDLKNIVYAGEEGE